jgi:transposase InsO family protein
MIGMESFGHILKNELIHRQNFQTRSPAQLFIFVNIEASYNRTRRRASIGFVSPARFQLQRPTAAQPQVHTTGGSSEWL